MNNIPFKKANILLPKNDFEKWSVIACDQFTSDEEYWNNTTEIVGDANSTLKITLPEVYLEKGDCQERIDAINLEMKKYLENGIFEEYKDAMIYVERIQQDGRIKAGIIGAVDLEEYDYSRNAKSKIRATEATVLERIPPRVKIRKDAPLELPHIILLIDDVNKTVIEPIGEQKKDMKKLYDFDLMMGGGHISGYLLTEDQINSVNKALFELTKGKSDPLLFAVGDGNHSLATAKECYNLAKKENSPCAELARYALAEFGNIHSDALDFEPIYRVVFDVDPEDIINEMRKELSNNANTEVKYVYGEKEGSLNIYVPAEKLCTGVVQDFIDGYIKTHPKARVDYIHGENDVKQLAKNANTVGFIYEGISKDTLFASVEAAGALPRKTFSMGESKDKRYYLECRKIK